MIENKYTIYDSVRSAYENSDNTELKADIFLTIYLRSEESKEYYKLQKKIAKLSKKVQKLSNNNGLYQEKIEQLSKKIEEKIKRKQELVEIAKNESLICDYSIISKRLIGRYRQGLMIVDAARKVITDNSSYGRMLYSVFYALNKDSPIRNIKRMMGKLEPTYLSKIQNDNPKLKERTYLDTEEGALLLESHFMIFLITLATKEYTEEQLKELLDDIAKEVAGDDEELMKKIKDLYKVGAVSQKFGKILLQIVRLSVGKGLFMNSLVKITNVALRFVAGRGMSFAQNALFRKYVARFLGGGPWAIALNIVLFVPDVAILVNKRDYLGVTKTILLLYFLRNSDIILKNTQP